MQVRFETIGCRLNQIETESAARIFCDKGFSVSLSPLNSSAKIDCQTLLCVVNTCAVTQKAEQKDRRVIRLLLEKCPNAAILVTGCYAQLAVDAISRIDGRIAVLPGQLKSRLSEVASLLQKNADGGADKTEAREHAGGTNVHSYADCTSGGEKMSVPFSALDFADTLKREVCAPPAAKIGFSEKSFVLSTDSFLAHSRSSIKIQDGCNSSCTYCAIRTARGHSVSLDAASVIERIRQLERTGQREVVFTAVNIGQYKGAYGGAYLDFADLLEKCLEATAKINFRISSLYPETVDERFCRVIRDRRVRPHFHLSVQSGSDKILSLMGRDYRRDVVLEACGALRRAKESPFIAADIITGFPSETAEDFADTARLCEECGFAWLHIFPFSARPGTAAFTMGEKVPQSVGTARAAELGLWAAKSKKKYIESCAGKTFSAILETVKNPALMLGESAQKAYRAVTENFLHCEIRAQKLPFIPGSEVFVTITGVDEARVKKGGEYDTVAVFA
ncbi:MAG: tRNA (N(6)-L-threonylcarbamoyladenosine(37)-C(2))-methylthiotransferase MtaB [Treponema sp.]